MIAQILPFIHASLFRTASALRTQGFDVQHGPLRPATISRHLTAGAPVIIRDRQGICQVLVGLTDDDQFIVHRDDMDETSPPVMLVDGDVDAIVVRPVFQSTANRIIWEEDQDDWPDEWLPQKARARAAIEKTNCVDERFVPAHPVIVRFQEPSKRKKMEDGSREADNRGYSDGVSITLLDHQDPTSVFFHELGHVYWDTRMTAEEKARAADIWQKHRSRTDIPVLVTGGWREDKTGVEMFCDCYMWIMKGQALGTGYTDILKARFRDGYDLVMTVVDRVGRELVEEAAVQVDEAVYLDHLDDVVKALDKPDGILLKAGPTTVGRISPARPDVKVPVSAVEIVRKAGQVLIARLLTPGAAGRTIALTPDYRPAWSYMKSHPGYTRTRSRRPRAPVPVETPAVPGPLPEQVSAEPVAGWSGKIISRVLNIF